MSSITGNNYADVYTSLNTKTYQPAVARAEKDFAEYRTTIEKLGVLINDIHDSIFTATKYYRESRKVSKEKNIAWGKELQGYENRWFELKKFEDAANAMVDNLVKAREDYKSQLKALPEDEAKNERDVAQRELGTLIDKALDAEAHRDCFIKRLDDTGRHFTRLNWMSQDGWKELSTTAWYRAKVPSEYSGTVENKTEKEVETSEREVKDEAVVEDDESPLREPRRVGVDNDE